MSNVRTPQGLCGPGRRRRRRPHVLGRLAGDRAGLRSPADTVEGLRAAFGEAVGEDVETGARTGKEPPRPRSGQVSPASAPASAAAPAAGPAGRSLNRWAEEALDRAAS